MIRNLNLTDNVILMNVRSDVAELMAGADILLMPSKFEGFPMVLVESQAIGLQALVSDRVSEETNLGLDLIKFLEIDKIDGWVDEIVKYSKQASFSENAYEVLRKKGFDLDSNVALLEQLYS
ncbi:MAG: glycosyltransferase [Chryseobacterium sp.]|uniref:glycosyltransferase n=1 Tax=Chryseobacterium sp. TaxID=1871047 RepID=UPI0025C36AB1|nr:glycosyltransferase [Chryseobacterium sp.]MCJ7932999.1 glycosyltransferase [Chryseobacterium sp.]